MRSVLHPASALRLPFRKRCRATARLLALRRRLLVDGTLARPVAGTAPCCRAESSVSRSGHEPRSLHDSHHEWRDAWATNLESTGALKFPGDARCRAPSHVRIPHHTGVSASFRGVCRGDLCSTSKVAYCDQSVNIRSPLPFRYNFSLSQQESLPLRSLAERLLVRLSFALMSGWDDVLEEAGSQPEPGGWSEVAADSDSDSPAGWGSIIDAAAAEEDEAQSGWGDVLEASVGSQSGGDTPQGVVTPGGEGAVALVAEARLAEVVVVPAAPKITAVVAEVREMLKLRPTDDAFKLGRSLAQLSSLPSTATFRGSPIFEEEAEQIGLALVQTKHIQTLRAVAEATGCSSHDKVGNIKCLMAAGIVQVERHRLVSMMDDLTAKVCKDGGVCVSLTFRHRYDETPLRARILQEALGSSAGALVAEDSGAALKESGCTKVVQHEWSGAALVFVNGHYELVSFSLPVWLSTVDRTTGEVYQHLCRQVTPTMPKIMDRFRRCQRLVTTDGDGAIARAERAMAQSESRSATMHQLCDVHRVSAIGKRSAEIISGDVTGMIQLALSLSSAGAMASFRRILRRALLDRLRIRLGTPGLVADERRGALLDLFFPIIPGRGTSVFRRRLIAGLANGDWDKPDVFEHYCNGCCKSEEDTRHKVCTLLVNVLARHACPTFPRSRWTRADRTLRWLGGLWVVHNLLPTVYSEWACRFLSKTRAARGASQGGPSSLAPIADMDMPEVEADGSELVGDAAAGQVDEADAWRPYGGVVVVCQQARTRRPLREGCL